jgi:hypothetical protein
MHGLLREYFQVVIGAVARPLTLRGNGIIAVLRDFHRGGLHWLRPRLVVALGRWLDREGLG